jgi:catechol 2,3-dioxygenase-like lactoylglutathione lyase family enzyme
MKIVPVIESGDLERSLQFYTEVLDFERKWPDMKLAATCTTCQRMFCIFASGCIHLVLTKPR